MEDIKNDLLILDGRQMYTKYLVGSVVWYFKDYLKIVDYHARYDDLKRYISTKLDVPFGNVAIVGSAMTGISFAPGKNLRPFTEQSDIDLVIVSEKYYKEIWRAYLEMFYRNIVPDGYREINASIFKGFISVSTSAKTHSDIIAWEKKVGEMMKDLQLFYGIKQDINYRIYDSWESVLAYHCHGLDNLVKNYRKEQHDKTINENKRNKLVLRILEGLKKSKDGND